jgi:hypothetical protein
MFSPTIDANAMTALNEVGSTAVLSCDVAPFPRHSVSDPSHLGSSHASSIRTATAGGSHDYIAWERASGVMSDQANDLRESVAAGASMSTLHDRDAAGRRPLRRTKTEPCAWPHLSSPDLPVVVQSAIPDVTPGVSSVQHDVDVAPSVLALDKGRDQQHVQHIPTASLIPQIPSPVEAAGPSHVDQRECDDFFKGMFTSAP